MRRIISYIMISTFLPFVATAQEAVTAKEGDGASRRQERRVMSQEAKRSVDISTNFFDWADFGTVNLDLGVSIARHFTLQLGAKYNPWEFSNPDGPVFLTKNQQKSASFGVRYWPWYVFSGWWICAKAQYCDYSECGVWRQALDEGKALGAGLSTGYTIMLGKHFNLEIGAGFWGGKLFEHALYDCPDPECMNAPRETGPKNFIAINDLNVSLHWVF